MNKKTNNKEIENNFIDNKELVNNRSDNFRGECGIIFKQQIERGEF